MGTAPSPAATAAPTRPRDLVPALLAAAAVALLVASVALPVAGATADCVSTATGLIAAAIAWRWQTAGYPAFVHRGRRVDATLDPRRRRSRRLLGFLVTASLVAAAIDRPGADAHNNVSPFVTALWCAYSLALLLAVTVSSVRSSRIVARLLRAPERGAAVNTWAASLGDVSGLSAGGSTAAMAILTEEVADLTMPTLVRESVLNSENFRLTLADGDAHVNPVAAYWASDVRLYPMTKSDERVQLVRAEMIPDGARVLVAATLRGQSGFGGRRLEEGPDAPLLLFASEPGSDPRAVLRRKVALRRGVLVALFATAIAGAATQLALRSRLPAVHSPWAE